jgi:pimeloyl-ACP methyl ester carboxylesterase
MTGRSGGTPPNPIQLANPFRPAPPPPLPPFRDGVADLGEAGLYYRDFGGDGPTVVLMHPATGSALIWTYQIPAFTAAGYRVIAYSRRGHYGSKPADPDKGGYHSRDLGRLADSLGLGRFAIVATAAGCSVTVDYAMDNSSRLTAVVVSSGAFGTVEEPEYIQVRETVRVAGYDEMPPEFRELGPSYRAANPDGMKEWVELEHKSLTGNRAGPGNVNRFTWETLGRISCPVLFIAGGADLAAPPTQMRMVAERVKGAELTVVPDSGHSVYWEHPDAFNAAVLGFLKRHAR